MLTSLLTYLVKGGNQRDHEQISYTLLHNAKYLDYDSWRGYRTMACSTRTTCWLQPFCRALNFVTEICSNIGNKKGFLNLFNYNVDGRPR